MLGTILSHFPSYELSPPPRLESRIEIGPNLRSDLRKVSESNTAMKKEILHTLKPQRYGATLLLNKPWKVRTATAGEAEDASEDYALIHELLSKNQHKRGERE